MTAAEVKEALRRRHPAIAEFGPGAWTCLEEWMQIDLLAFAAWTQPRPARCHYERVGYEVKVSRADYKRELQHPYKRSAAVAFCHEFYFAVPEGLLKPDELAWKPPEGFAPRNDPWERERCPGAFGAYCRDGRLQFGVHRDPAPEDGLPRPWWNRMDYTRAYDAECPTCRGAGWIVEAPAVRADAPRLWIPADVGLILITARGCVVWRKAPLNPDPSPISDRLLGDLVRWVSVRPDPRHRGEVREPEAEITQSER